MVAEETSFPGVRGLKEPAFHRREPGRLRRLWRECFTENPLIPIATGLGEGRSRLRSPMVWACGVCVAAPLMGLLFGFSAGFGAGRMGSALEDWQFGRGVDLGLLAAVLLIALLNLLSFVLPPWFAAASWVRDRDPLRRDQISTTLITPAQLIGARTLIWLLPIMLVQGLQVLITSLQGLWAVLTGNPLAAEFVEVGMIPESMTSPLVLILVGGVTMGVSVVITVGWWLIGLGFVTRFALRWHNPLSNLVLTGLCVLGVSIGVGIISVLPFFFLFFGSRGGGPALSPMLQMALMLLIQLLLVIGVARSIWKRLPGRVADVYALQR